VLTDTAGALSGFIDAARLLGYPVVSNDEGAAVNGAWSDATFTLHSTVFTDSHTGASRQVILHSGVISDDGESLTGVYSETLWSVTPEPLVISGEFRLSRPAHIPPAGQAFDLQVSAMPDRLVPLEGATVNATLKDFYSNPISETSVSFAASAGAVTPFTATTSIEGEAFATYTASDTPGWATITATSGAIVGTTQVQVMPYSCIYLPLVLKSH
jgi:hypothetical protein